MFFNLKKYSKTSESVTFDSVVTRFHEPLYHYLRRIVVNHDDAADLLQDIFIIIYENLNQLKSAEALKSWVYRIATNEASKFLKRRNISTGLSTSLDDEDNNEINRLRAASYVDFDNAIAVTFQEALLTLSEMQRTVFSLRYYEDLSYQEISEVTGSSVDSLKVIYHNAKERITQYILNNAENYE
jgi:RNA polymerase sigma-70 factor (ECF subfamily)